MFRWVSALLYYECAYFKRHQGDIMFRCLSILQRIRAFFRRRLLFRGYFAKYIFFFEELHDIHSRNGKLHQIRVCFSSFHVWSRCIVHRLANLNEFHPFLERRHYSMIISHLNLIYHIINLLY